MKKAATIKKKLIEKIDKVLEKVWSKNQFLNMRRLALSNTSEIGNFKEVLSDPPINNSDD